MEIFLKTYYNNIDTFTVDNVERIPTGSICLNRYVNNNKELKINSFIDYIEKDGQLTPVIENVDVTKKISDCVKEEYKHRIPYYAYDLLEQQQAKENKE